MYNYKSEMYNDVYQYIKENVNWSDYDTIDQLEIQLNDDMFVDDSVTGNGSGSYWFNSAKAEEVLICNFELLKEACEELGINGFDIIENGAEYADVIIRCYLLSDVISSVLHDMEDNGEINFEGVF